MLLLGVLKLRNMYILPPVNVSILFSPLLDFVLKLFSEVDIGFVLSNLLFFYRQKPW